MSHPSIAPHLNRPTERDQDHVIVAENEVPPTATQEKSSRSVKWTAEEEEMLISTWLTISNDSVIGNAQTRGSFWGDNQIIEAARLNWKNAHKKKEFPYMHIWEMVKDEPKWAAQIEAQNASKKAKTSESGAYTSSSNRDVDEYSYGGNQSESRPIVKEKGKKNVTESVNVEFKNRWKMLEEFQAQKLAVLNEIKNKAKDDTLRADYEILMKDTTTMSNQQLANHNHMCSIIKARHGIPYFYVPFKFKYEINSTKLVVVK
uniref:No apical meristem-associated C-terminal domain-containing protein n=1 Tax=Kalanchoe fedtschenkoi TaxID=63787 RepID=A0A7N0TLK1_KALFE